MKKILAVFALLVCLAGCKGEKNPLSSVDTMALATAKSEFDGYIRQWETRVADGSWAKMVADGSWVKLVPEEKRDGDPMAFPAARIAELKEARDKMTAELKRRSK